MSESTNQIQQTRPSLGLPIWGIVGLAALGVPRVVLHDLALIPPNGWVPTLLTLGPVAIWIGVVVLLRTPRPFVAMLAIGATYGALLVITHQLLWNEAFGPNLPSVFGSTLVPRMAAIPSGLFTGALIGAVGGLIAWGIRAVIDRRPQE